MPATPLPAPITTYEAVPEPFQTNQDVVIMVDPTTVFSNVEYKPPVTQDDGRALIDKGNIGSVVLDGDGFQMGAGVRKVGMSGEGNNERMYIGDPNNPNVVIGQLFSKTGIDEYGIWVGGSGYFTGTVTASTFIGGAIHIPDQNTTTNSFHTDSTGLSWWGATESNKAVAPVRINPNGYMTLGDPTGIHLQFDGPNKRIRSSDYVANVSGFHISSDLIEAENLRARGMMNGTTFKYDVVSAVGGQLMVANSDVLDADMSALDSATITISGATTFSNNDILLVRALTNSGIQEEWMRVTNSASAPQYTVTRDLAGAYAANSNPQWKKGTTVVVQGKSDGVSTYSGGWLRLFGQGSNSPYYSVYVRTGINYNNYTEIARFGNLNGIGGFVSDTFGIFIGNYSNGQYISYDSVSSTLNLNNYVQTGVGTFAGNGSDGVVPDANLTITGSDNTIITKNYSSWTAGSVARTLTVTPKNCIVIIKIKGNADFTNWSLDFSGKGPAGGTGGAAVTGNGISPLAGNAGASASNAVGTLYSIISGGGGGGGLTNATGSATNPGIAAPAKILPILLSYMQAGKMVIAACGGGGGGGGSGTVSANASSQSGKGGDGGAGGGCVIFEIGGNVTFSSTTATVAGSNGQNGSNGVNSGWSQAGGGGGGAGGTFIMLYNGTLTGSLTPTVTGGSAGSAGNSNSFGGAGDRIGAVGGAGASSLSADGNASGSTNGMTAGTAGAGANGQYYIARNVAFA